VLGILKHLGIGRAPAGSIFLGGMPALILHFAAIEAHPSHQQTSLADLNIKV
jgi:hypothetical protein